jgi:hypothetical protein
VQDKVVEETSFPSSHAAAAAALENLFALDMTTLENNNHNNIHISETTLEGYRRKPEKLTKP